SWSVHADLRSSMPAIAASPPTPSNTRTRGDPTAPRTGHRIRPVAKWRAPVWPSARRVWTVRQVMAGVGSSGGGRTMAEKLITVLLDRYGRTFAEEAGIRLADRPAPLYQLLVLATLLSARISAGVAVAAARELFRAGYRTPQAMSQASWQDRVDALGRG